MNRSDAPSTEWRVLLVGGHSGAGKTIAAERLGLALGVPWMMADDIRLAFQRAHVRLPDRTDALYFDTTPGFWRQRPEEMRDALIAVGEVLSPALEVIIENHVDQSVPVVIEGDTILPSLLLRQSVLERASVIRAAFLVEPDESEVISTIVQRGRAIVDRTDEELTAEGRAKWLFGQWLAQEAARYDVPVIEPRPWDTLHERLVAGLGLER